MKKWISLITVIFIVLGVNFSEQFWPSLTIFKVPKAAVAYYLTEDGTAGN